MFFSCRKNITFLTFYLRFFSSWNSFILFYFIFLFFLLCFLSFTLIIRWRSSFSVETETPRTAPYRSSGPSPRALTDGLVFRNVSCLSPLSTKIYLIRSKINQIENKAIETNWNQMKDSNLIGSIPPRCYFRVLLVFLNHVPLI